MVIRIEVEDFDTSEEIRVFDLTLFGHFDERMFYDLLYWNGLVVRSNQEYIEITIPKSLAEWQRQRLIEVFRRFGFSQSDLEQISGLADEFGGPPEFENVAGRW